jgi:AcrR family transcriptional regulator
MLAAERLLLKAPPQALSVTAICAEARLSRRTFYLEFDDRSKLLLAVFDDVAGRACAAMAAARSTEASWLSGVRAALIELLYLLDGDQDLARFLIVDSLAGDAALLAHRARALRWLGGALEAGAPPPAAGSLPAPFGGEAVVGGVAAILHARLLEQPVPLLRELSGSLMSVIVLPYLGVRAARAELARPLPQRAVDNGARLSLGPCPSERTD